jgi:hypothetical protein
MLMSVDLAIGSYRKAVSDTIPQLTRIAWRDKRKEIEAATPGVTEQSFVFTFSRQQYEQEFGTKYQKPGTFSRMLAFVLKIVPKIGPFKPLSFEPLTPEAEKLMVDSVTTSRARYRAFLTALRARRLELPNTDFDTGRAPVLGENRLADDTHVDLLHKLAKENQADVPAELRQQMARFFASEESRQAQFKRKEAVQIGDDLTRLSRR